jgi:two-component system, OmpR family, response regulator VicR
MQEELIQQYIESLKKRLEKVNSLAQKLAGGNTKADENIRLIAHSLHGSGASFGFPEISEAANAAEHASSEELGEKLEALMVVIEKVVKENPVQAATPEESPDPSSKKKSSASKKKLKILVVDDDPDITDRVCNTLKQLPKKSDITVVDTGAKAQELFVREQYDLIIMDLMLPDRDGRELINEIKLEFKIKSPLLVLSGIQKDEVRVECMSLGADKFLSKPFYEEDLLEMAKNLLGKTAAKKLTLVPMDGETAEEDEEDDEEKVKALAGFDILLAEDDKMQALLIDQTLSKQGATVHYAKNGREAMQLLRSKAFALVILDVNMPMMTGFEVLQRLKDELNLVTPVIMLTAMGDEEDIIKGYELGATDYMLKPFSEILLTARVKSLLKC